MTLAVAVVGLEQTFYNVSEDVGEVELCVRVFEPDVECPIAFPFDVRLSTKDGTAGKRNLHANCMHWGLLLIYNMYIIMFIYCFVIICTGLNSYFVFSPCDIKCSHFTVCAEYVYVKS